jgi:hypothetical protein
MIYESSLKHHGILGMKWGVRRYQNKDGSLTAEGEKRHAKEKYKNSLQKQKNQLSDEGVRDVDRWVKDDLEKAHRVVKTGSDTVRELQRMERETSPKPKKERMDLSKMTDQELRQKINRELIERQYNDLFGKTSEPKISKGRKYLRETLDIAGGVLAVGASSLSIALAIKELKG